MMKNRHRPRSNVPPRPHAHSQPPRTQAPRKDAVVVEGILDITGKFGFVLSVDPKVGDVMIQGPTLGKAMGGDRVRARVTSPPDAARRSGEIIDVLIHAHQTVVGTFRRMGNLPVVAPEDEGAVVHLVDLGTFVPHVGDIVTARVQSWPTDKEAAKAVLIEVLGPRDAPGVDLQSLVRKYELPDAFPPDVIKEAEGYGTDVPESAYKNRETFFDQRVFTIDGADAKDFDDAVSLELLPDGWRLGVHIADVAHYVQ